MLQQSMRISSGNGANPPPRRVPQSMRAMSPPIQTTQASDAPKEAFRQNGARKRNRNRNEGRTPSPRSSTNSVPPDSYFSREDSIGSDSSVDTVLTEPVHAVPFASNDGMSFHFGGGNDEEDGSRQFGRQREQRGNYDDGDSAHNGRRQYSQMNDPSSFTNGNPLRYVDPNDPSVVRIQNAPPKKCSKCCSWKVILYIIGAILLALLCIWLFQWIASFACMVTSPFGFPLFCTYAYGHGPSAAYSYNSEILLSQQYASQINQQQPEKAPSSWYSIWPLSRWTSSNSNTVPLIHSETPPNVDVRHQNVPVPTCPPPVVIERHENVAVYFRELVRRFQTGEIGRAALKGYTSPNTVCFEVMSQKRFREMLLFASTLMAYDTCTFEAFPTFEAKVAQNVAPFQAILADELVEMVKAHYDT